MDVVTVVSELEAGRTSTLGPRRLPSLHLFFLVLLVIYMAFLVGRCVVVLIRHSSAVPRSGMKKPRRKADQQCPCSTRTSQPDVYMMQVLLASPDFFPLSLQMCLF